MIERTIQVNPAFEVSSAAKLVQTASVFKSHISLVAEEKTANAKSIMGIFSLELHGGGTIKIIADGEDAQAAVSEIEKIFVSGRQANG
ncbi:MAG: HPr family phosphocarrier protein [Defluviitaleaceae bacterium]|nr:HPr family phosphocarrier protein [Defluviitaleaceae bacterium]